MDGRDIIIHQRTYKNKAIFKYIKHSEHFRTEEYICTNEDGDIWLERADIIDDIETNKKIFQLIKASPTTEEN